MNTKDHEDTPGASALGVDEETQLEAEAQAAEVLREHDTASRYRTKLGLWAWVVGGLSVALTLFHLYTGIFGSRPSLIQGAIHLGAAASLIFLLYPAGKRIERRGGKIGIPGGMPCLRWSPSR